MSHFLSKKDLLNPLIFNAEYYISHHDDLRAMSLNRKEAAEHFLKHGLKEGRTASPIFNAQYYLNENLDILESTGHNYQLAARHFLKYGINESRKTSACFDVNFYYRINPDLQNAFGRDFKQLYTHFMDYGYKENRRHNPFTMPDSMRVELTNTCNLHCNTCPREYDHGSNMKVGNLKIEKALDLLNELMPFITNINLTGLGETFLFKDLLTIIDAINSNGKTTTFLSTNAQTLNCLPMMAQIAGKVNMVQISIDGIGKVYEDVRKVTDFSNYAANVKEIYNISKNQTTELKLNMVVYPPNFLDMKNVVSFANEMGINKLNIHTRNLVAIPGEDISEYDLYKSPKFKAAMDEAQAVADQLGIYVSTFSTTHSNTDYCEMILNNYYVTWDGFLVPCCAKPFPKEKNFGNVFQEGIASCIKNYQTSSFRTSWDRGEIPNFCERCYKISNMQDV